MAKKGGRKKGSKRSSKRKSSAGKASFCKTVKVNGRRRKLCFRRKKNCRRGLCTVISSNTKA
jgi:hypothetical protein